MDKKKKSEFTNQWAGPNTTLASKTGVKQKDENNNQWCSTSKKSPEMYADNCHPEKHNK